MEEEFYSNQKDINDEPKNFVNQDEFTALQEVIKILKDFDKRTLKRLLNTVITFFDLSEINQSNFINNATPNFESNNKFTENRDITPKEFMLEKNPQTDVERIACLAYYLTHYREQVEFKTVDLSQLNTEAAQLKLSNPAFAVDHATRSSGFLVPTKKGFKKLSAIGEMYVRALPDRDEAKEIIAKNKPKKRLKKNKKMLAG